MLAIHALVMVLILAVSLIITPEPYAISDDQVDGSFDMEDGLGTSKDNTYIVDVGDRYELYIDGEFAADMHEIPEDFRDYPVYTEKPNE